MIDAIERTLELSAAPERVWRALTDPEELASWFPDETVDLDVRPGGDGWWRWKEHGRYAVRFDVVEPPRRLVWTWAREADTPVEEAATTTVEWVLEPREDGGTTVSLRESGFLTAEAREQNVHGWKHELGELVEHLEAGVGGPAGDRA